MEHPFRVHSEDSFDAPDAETVIMAPMPEHEEFESARATLHRNQTKAPPELRVFYEEPLLTREQEYHLFKQYNFLKHQAKRILQISDPSNPVAADVEQVEKLLSAASLIKRQLASSNVRLVMSIAKKQKEYIQNPNIDLLAEIVSDGYMGLMRAVDYFDYRLGNKFSTYATWAVLDTMKRSRNYRIKHSACMNGFDKALCEVMDNTDSEKEYDDLEAKVPVEELLMKIPARQRQVIIDYYGLNGEQAKGLQEIGDEVGLSKERIRQLREAGLDKLREMLTDA